MGNPRSAPGIEGPARLDAAAYLPTQLSIFRRAVARTYLRGDVVELVTDGIGDEATAALALCRAPHLLARWRVVGSNELFEPVDAVGASLDGLAAKLARLRRPMDLNRLPDSSPLVPALRAALRGRAWITIRPAAPRPVITLPAGLNDPLDLFSAERRSDFRRALRRAERAGSVSFEVHCPDPDDFDALYDEAIGIEARSWKREAGSALAVDSDKRAFFRAFLKEACAQRLTRIAFMRIDGQAAAMQLALEWRDRFWLFKIGYDEAYRQCSPGNLLMLHTLGYAGRNSLTGYELLGNCESWIRKLWTTENQPCIRVRTYPHNLPGMAALCRDGTTWLVGRAIAAAAGWAGDLLAGAST